MGPWYLDQRDVIGVGPAVCLGGRGVLVAIGLGVAVGAGVEVAVAADVSVAANVEVDAGCDTVGVEAFPQPASTATPTNTLTMSHGHMDQFYQTKYPEPGNLSLAASSIASCELGSGREESGVPPCRYESTGL